MILVKELEGVTEQASSFLEKQREIKEFEVFASTNRLDVLRIVFATNVPNNALEEPKSIESTGLSIRVLFKNKKIGFGKEDAELSLQGIKSAFKKAQKNAVLDQDFKSFPSPKEGQRKKPVFDKAIMNLNEEKAIQSAYTCLDGALGTLEKKNARKNLNITGEINFLAQKMSVKNSNGINATDQNTAGLSTLTTILEQKPDLAGMWFDSAIQLKKLNTFNTGKVSVEKAVEMQNPKKINSKKYKVVFGRLAFAELLYSRFEVGLNAVDIKASPFVNKLDKVIASSKISICDDGAKSGEIGTKNYTDEGLPTGKTELVKKGKLVNFLANDYYAKKFGDPRFKAKNGFRGGGGGRNYETSPGISASNIVVSSGNYSDEELIKEVKNGVFVGRLWYTYPVNGLASADFTSTVRGDSFLIEKGEIKTALVPNTLRINDNLNRVLKNIIGVGKKKLATFAWAQESIVITPEIAVGNVKLERIAKDIY